MKDKYLKNIEKINENIDILPTNNKTNIAKYNAYIDDQINTYKHELEEVKKEITLRYNKYLDSFKKGDEIKEYPKLDIDLIRGLDKKTTAYEKMNLGYYLYKLDHFYESDIDKINEVILKVIDIFKGVNVTIKPEDYMYSESVNYYIETLLGNKENIHEILDKLYWENPNLIYQIKLNFRHIYFKYEKDIEKYYNLKYLHQNLNSYLKDNFVQKNQINNMKHNNRNYLFKLFDDDKLSIVDFKDKNIDTIIDNLLLDKDSSDNYINLCKLEQSLVEYNSYMDFEYIIADMKELYTKKTEYKGLYDNKLKDIKKKESSLFKINKQISGKGLFKKKDKQINKLKLDRTKIVDELNNLYNELDNLRIKDLIFKYVNDDTTLLEVVRIAAFDFNYFVSLLKKQIDDLNADDIDKNISDLYEFAYGINHNIFSNIAIIEDKNITQIIADRYRLINLQVNEEDLEKDKIEKLLENVQNIIIHFDMARIDMNMSHLEFVTKVEKILQK